MEANKATVILVTGACGQIGTELVKSLREKYGKDAVIATDRLDATDELIANGPYFKLNILDKHELESLVNSEAVTQIYHLAAMLSASGEKEPLTAWNLNMEGLLNVLETARIHNLDKIFWPSSIAVFGPNSPQNNCPQHTVLEPATMYGISKAAGENLCQYYYLTYGLDIRSLRYPGLISYSAKPGGGTTDYAVDIYHKALNDGSYNCYLQADACLPMMYMPDAIRATIELMEAPAQNITIRTAYNVAGLSFTPAQIAEDITRQVPDFKITYAPDFRQKIAESWPNSIDDSFARTDWQWHPQYPLNKMTDDMLMHLREMMHADAH